MIGIFQIFGISFLFWTAVGCLRFIFDTLQELHKSSRTRSSTNLAIASIGGLGATVLFLLLFFSDFRLFEITSAESLTFAFAAFPLWVIAIVVGAYVASRIYVHDSYIIGSVVSLGAIALGTSVFFSQGAGVFPTSVYYVEWNIWIIFTICSGLIGSNLAQQVNQWEKRYETVRKKESKKARRLPEDIAVVIAAHNEELTIGTTIESLKQITRVEHIYIGSDGSKDRTTEIVRGYGCNVDNIQPNRGKAGALTYVLEHNNLLNRYKAVFFIDADIKVDKNFYTYALPYFEDPKVMVLVSNFVPLWPKHNLPQWRLFFTAYRIRLWLILQYCLRYGQTWKYTNVTPIASGGASIYRSEALKRIRIDTPGLIIEDFNMTFNIHHQHLGHIAFDPRAFVWDQEPFSLDAYYKQIKRWYLGFFQTIRLHKVWPSFFCLSTYTLTLELLVGSVLFLAFPFLIAEMLILGKTRLTVPIPLTDFHITLLGVVVAVFVLDYLVTLFIALIERKPLLLVYGLGFIFLRYLEAGVFLYMMGVGLFLPSKNDGRWISPERISYNQQ